MLVNIWNPQKCMCPLCICLLLFIGYNFLFRHYIRDLQRSLSRLIYFISNLQVLPLWYLTIKKKTSGSKMAFSSSMTTWQGNLSLTPQRTRFYSWEMEWALLLSLRLVSWQGSRWTNQERNMYSAGNSFRGPRSLRPTTSTNKSQTPLGQQRHFSAGSRLTVVRLSPSSKYAVQHETACCGRFVFVVFIEICFFADISYISRVILCSLGLSRKTKVEYTGSTHKHHQGRVVQSPVKLTQG